MTTPILTQKILRELIHYDSDTGIFTWKARSRRWFTSNREHTRWNARYSGVTAGGIDAEGYCRIGFLGVRYKAHRLAFLYMIGVFPPNDTDHIKGDRADNRWGKIRAATRLENMRNKAIPKNNTSGRIGVNWNKINEKWRSKIWAEGKGVHLGYFDHFEDAVAAREAAELEYNYHPNHGRAL